MTSKKEISVLKNHYKKYQLNVDGETLIVGSKLYENSYDRRHWYANVTGIDFQAGEGVDVVHDIQHYIVINGGVKMFDHIDCCSVLEHVENPWRAALNLQRVLKKGGTILLSVPFVWRVHGYPDDYWRFTKSGIKSIFDEIDWVSLGYFGFDGKKIDRAASFRDENNVPWLARTEIVGVGIKK